MLTSVGGTARTVGYAGVALCLSACHDGEPNPARGQPAESGQTEAASPLPPLEPVNGTLVDSAWRLGVRFDPRAPTVTLSIHEKPYAVDDVSLVLQKETVDGSVARRGGAVPARATRSYRLRFAIDECENEPPTPSGKWPGLCGYPEGGPRPRRIAGYELLVDVDSLYSSTEDIHRIDAACVPTSGRGPICQLNGTAVTHAGPSGEEQ